MTMHSAPSTDSWRSHLLESADDIRDLLARTHRVAVLGIKTPESGQPAFYVAEYAQQAGYEVVPVHPKLKTLDDGTPVFASVKDIPEPPAVVDLVVPPTATVQVVRDCLEAGIKGIWFQPGTENRQGGAD